MLTETPKCAFCSAKVMFPWAKLCSVCYHRVKYAQDEMKGLAPKEPPKECRCLRCAKLISVLDEPYCRECEAKIAEEDIVDTAEENLRKLYAETAILKEFIKEYFNTVSKGILNLEDYNKLKNIIDKL